MCHLHSLLYRGVSSQSEWVAPDPPGFLKILSGLCGPPGPALCAAAGFCFAALPVYHRYTEWLHVASAPKSAPLVPGPPLEDCMVGP